MLGEKKNKSVRRIQTQSWFFSRQGFVFTVVRGEPPVCTHSSAPALPRRSVLQEDARVLQMCRSVLYTQSGNEADESECRWQLWANQKKLHYGKCQQQFWSTPQKLGSWQKFVETNLFTFVFITAIFYLLCWTSILLCSFHKTCFWHLLCYLCHNKSCYDSPWRIY